MEILGHFLFLKITTHDSIGGKKLWLAKNKKVVWLLQQKTIPNDKICCVQLYTGQRYSVYQGSYN